MPSVSMNAMGYIGDGGMWALGLFFIVMAIFIWAINKHAKSLTE